MSMTQNIFRFTHEKKKLRFCVIVLSSNTSPVANRIVLITKKLNYFIREKKSNFCRLVRLIRVPNESVHLTHFLSYTLI